MSMIISNYLRSPCEVIREINDMFQGDNIQHRVIRKKLAEIERMAKEMSIEISKHDPEYHKRIWTEKNEDLEQDDSIRKNPNYKYHKL